MKKRLLSRILPFLLIGLGTFFFTSCEKNDDLLGGKDYKVELPSSAKDLVYEEVSDERLEEIQRMGLDVVGRPISVTTKDGDPHVYLDDYATVSFVIPSDIPEEDYRYLVGVLITDDGPEYVLPDFDKLYEGVVSFETLHFCDACVTKLTHEKQRELLTEKVAAGGWYSVTSSDEFTETFKEQFWTQASALGLGENDFFGAAAREVLNDNEIFNDVADLIDSKNKFDHSANYIAEKMKSRLKEKTLGLLFDKLKKYPGNQKLKEYMEEHLTEENAKGWAEELGSGKSPAEVAKKYASGFAESKLKDFSRNVLPIISTMEKTAAAINFAKKFWASHDMQDLYKFYKKNADASGNIDAALWDVATLRMIPGAVRTKFGMSDEEIKEQLKQRLLKEREIERMKPKIKEMIEDYDLDLRVLKLENRENKHFTSLDYTQRLIIIHRLYERFRRELCRNGRIPNADVTDIALSEIVRKFIELYPDQQAFYDWLRKKGYYQDKFKSESDALDNQRAWYRIRTDLFKSDDKSSDGSGETYSVSENKHMKHQWNSEKYYSWDDELCPPYDLYFSATCTTPPECMYAGDSISMHATIELNGTEKVGYYLYADVSMSFDKEDVSMGFIYYTDRPQAVNVKGRMTVGSRWGENRSGECDFVYKVPSGSKDQLRAMNFDGCGSRTHWVYKWCSIFEQ